MLRGIHFIWRPACEAGLNPREFAVQTCFQGRYGAQTGSDECGAHIVLSGAGLGAWRCSTVEFFYHVGVNSIMSWAIPESFSYERGQEWFV